MPFLAGVQPPLLLAAPLLSAASFSGCLNEAVRNCGMSDQEIAERIHISHGYMSKFMRGVAQQWAKRLVAFMRVTNSLTPLQWMAHQMGCRLVMEDESARELAQARARVAELERMERMAA
jgi:transcriptional regulator with XRE-family HTH domain